MDNLEEKRSRTTGLPPGTMVHVGESRKESVKITVVDYDAEHVHEETVEKASDCAKYKDTATVTWINVSGIHQLDIIAALGRDFGLHPLTQEDIVNTEQRPKLEDYDSYLYLVLRTPYYDREEKEIDARQVSLILTDSCVISFQEEESFAFKAIRQRIQQGKGRIRKMGADYLAYALLDAIVDHSFTILETLGERVDDLEDELAGHPESKTLEDIHDLKRDIILLRKTLWPMRGMVNSMLRETSPLIKEPTRVYLQDAYDNMIQAIDNAETFRDMVNGMLDTYISLNSFRMNEVIKVLTIIATIFMPLTFITGWYGMNLRMPEIKWVAGYPFVIGLTLLMIVGMLVYFKRKRWF